jgi:hypothetical protein
MSGSKKDSVAVLWMIYPKCWARWVSSDAGVSCAQCLQGLSEGWRHTCIPMHSTCAFDGELGMIMMRSQKGLVPAAMMALTPPSVFSSLLP